ncbi:MAG: O-antigen ligase family protein [Patescibacteria group bacterium]
MKPKVYLLILRLGVFLSLLTVFLVFRNLLFPYITSKQLVLNILMEFLLAITLVFWWKFPSYRPKKSWITWGLISYFIAIIASLFVTIDFNLSFWGDAERMLGLFHLFHFLILYFIIITAFREKKDWKLLFLASILVAVVESYFCLKGQLAYGTIGNTAYVSGYLIFNLFFAAILFLKSKSKLWRWLYLIPVVIMLFAFRRANTSGAIIGLGISVLLFLFLFGFFQRNKKLKYWTLGIASVLVLGVIFVFSQSQSDWFQSSTRLRNLTSQKSTFQTRLVSWRGAAADFKFHPILGVGYGNYASVFDRQFDPKFYNYSRTETYFDRAHNNLIDIVTTTGLLGLLAYLSIFVALFYYLFLYFKPILRDYRGGEEGSSRQLAEVFLIVSLVVAYFIQNLAVFDSLVTYMGLMIILAYVYYLVQIKPEDGEEEARPAIKSKTEYIALGSVIIVALVFIYTFNVRPWRMFVNTINSYSQTLSGDVVNGLNSYREALDSNTGLERDARFSFIGLISTNPAVLSYLTPAEAQDTLAYTVSLAQKNLSYNEEDSLGQLQLAQIADLGARVNYQDQVLFERYSTLSLNAIDAAIKASPRRPTLYFAKAQLLLARGDKEGTIESMKYGISLNPEYPDGHCQLALIYILLDDDEASYPYVTSCLDNKGQFAFPEKALTIWAKHYTALKDTAHLEQINAQLEAYKADSLAPIQP